LLTKKLWNSEGYPRPAHLVAEAYRWFAVHPDGTSVLCHSPTDPKQVEWWDLSTEKPQKRRALPHPDPVYWVCVSPDGKRAATACENARAGQIFLWDLETGAKLLRIPLPPRLFQGRKAWEIEGYEGGLKAMAFSPDGELLAVVDPTGVRLWRTDPQK
jgi:WD40 repeat protein